MADITWTTGVNLAGLTSGLAAARAQITAFGHGTSTITVNLRVNYTGPTAAHLASITAAIHALHGAASTPITLALGGLGNLGGLAAGAGLGGLTAGIYDLAKASDDARISQIAFEKQVGRNGYSFDEAGAAVEQLTMKLKISKTQAMETISTMLKSGASINQAVMFAQAGAASALSAGKSASVGIQAVTESLQSGLSATLNNAGISQNLSTYLARVAKEAGKATDALSDMEKATAMEKLLKDAVILPGELAMLDTALGGVTGKAGEMNANLQAVREQLGKPLVSAVVAVLDRAAGALLAVSKTSPETAQMMAKLAVAAAAAAAAWNVQAIATWAATAATTAYGNAVTKITAISSAIMAAPWMAVAVAAGVALSAAIAYYTKVQEEEAKRVQADVDARNKAIKGARDGTAGTEYDDRAAALANRVYTLRQLAQEAKATLADLFSDPSIPPTHEAVEAAKEDYRKYNAALKGSEQALKSLKDTASDKAALAGWNAQLKAATVVEQKQGLDSLGKALEDVKKRHDALAASAKTTFKTKASQDVAVGQVEKLRQQAIDQTTARLGKEAASKAADAERAAEKARVNAMEDGLSKRQQLREIDIADVKAKYAKMEAQYKSFPEAVVGFQKAAEVELAAIRSKGLREDEAYVNEVVNRLGDQLNTAKAGALEGAAKINAQASADLAKLQQGEKVDLSKVAGNAQATAQVKRDYEQLRTLRRQEAAKGLKEQAETETRATRERLDAIHAAELAGYQAAADARVRVQERALARELAAAQGNQQKELAAYQAHALRIADARAAAIRAAARSEVQGVLDGADRTAGEKGTTPAQAAKIRAQAQADARRILAGAEADVADTYATSREDLAQRTLAAQRAATEEAHTYAEAVAAGTKASADYAAATAQTVQQEAAARAQNLEALRRELAIKQQIAAEKAADPNATGSERQNARNDVQAAQTALVQQELQDRQAIAAERLRGVDLTDKELQHELSLATTARERLAIEERQRGNLADRVATLQVNLSEAKTLQERRGIEDQITQAKHEQEKLGKGILDTTREASAEALRAATRPLDVMQQQIEFEKQLTVSAVVREQLAARERDALSQRMAILARAQTGNETPDRQRELQDQLTQAQQSYAKSVEESRKARLGELDAQRELRASLLDSALSRATSLTGRTAARTDIVGELRDQNAMLDQQITIYQQQGRAQTEINGLITTRAGNLARITQLEKEQLADQEHLVELAESLTSKNRELAAVAVSAFAEGSEQRRVAAVRELDLATTALTRSTRNYLAQQQALAPAGVTSEANADKLGKAMDRQQAAIQRAVQALAALRGEAQAQKSIMDQLLGSVQQYGTQARDQGILDRLKDRAGDSLKAAIAERQKVMQQYGASSTQFAEADQKVAQALQLATSATQAAAENRTKAIQDVADANQRAQEQVTRYADLPQGATKAFDLKQAGLGDQMTQIKLETERAVRDLAASAATISDPLFSAIDVWKQRLDDTNAKVKQAQKGLQSDTSLLQAVQIRVDPTQAEETGRVFGEAAVRPLSDWARATLANIRAAPVGAQAGAPAAQASVVNNTTYAINGLNVRLDQDMQQQFRAFMQYCQRQSAQNNAAGVAQ